MKIIATILLSFVVLITAFFCFILSICAIGSGGTERSRITYALFDLVDIGIMIGAVLLIAKLNKKNPL